MMRDGVDGGDSSRQLAHHVTQVIQLTTHLVYHLSHRECFEEELAVGDGVSLSAAIHCRQGFVGHVVQVVLEDGAGDGTRLLDDGNLLGYILEFAYVAVPRVFHDILFSVVGKEDRRHLVTFGHIRGEFAEKQRDVLLALTERRNID